VNPYPQPEAAPLTDHAAAHLRTLLEQAQQQRQEVSERRTEFDRQLGVVASDYERQRAALVAEMDAQDTLGAELDATITRYRLRLGASAAPERAAQERTWTGPETGIWQAPELSTDPDAALGRFDQAHNELAAKEGR
jgi:hypothetical protein